MKKPPPIERIFTPRPLTLGALLEDLPQLANAGPATWITPVELPMRGLFGADVSAPRAPTREAPPPPAPEPVVAEAPRAPSLVPEPPPPAGPTPEEIEAMVAERCQIAEAEAVAVAEAKVQAILDGYADAIARLEHATSEMTRTQLDTVVSLAMVVVRELVHRTLRVDPTLLAEQLESALASAGGETRLRVRIGPTDRAVLEARRPELFASVMEVVEDDTLGFGGCVVETPRHVIDASIETRLGAIAESLRANLADVDLVGAPTERPSIVPSHAPADGLDEAEPRRSLSPRPSLVPPPRGGPLGSAA